MIILVGLVMGSICFCEFAFSLIEAKLQTLTEHIMGWLPFAYAVFDFFGTGIFQRDGFFLSYDARGSILFLGDMMCYNLLHDLLFEPRSSSLSRGVVR